VRPRRTEAQFIELKKARNRLLVALGTRAAAPKMPEFAPKERATTLQTTAPAAHATNDQWLTAHGSTTNSLRITNSETRRPQTTATC
jgi:hypothetical protein